MVAVVFFAHRESHFAEYDVNISPSLSIIFIYICLYTQCMYFEHRLKAESYLGIKFIY